MINLLPPKTKIGYRYARRNKHLFKWLLVLLFGILGAIVITGVGFIYLHQITTSYSKQIEISKKQLKEQRLEQVDSRIQEMSNNLTLAVQVLSKQVLFSELLKKLSSLMPSDTILSNLSVSEAQGALDITAKAKDYNSATQIQVNLSADNNGLFSKVDLVNVTCNESSTDGYPCTATLRALFSADSQIAVIGKQSASTGAAKP